MTVSLFHGRNIISSVAIAAKAVTQFNIDLLHVHERFNGWVVVLLLQLGDDSVPLIRI